MIVVTRLNDRQFAVNPDLIERIHANPDTTIVMVDGAKYIVTESVTEVIDRIALYRARVIALAHTSAALVPAAPHLDLVGAPRGEAGGEDRGDAVGPTARGDAVGPTALGGALGEGLQAEPQPEAVPLRPRRI